MKITKKCGNTQTKISIKEKLDELRNRRRSSAGMFYTSSAGAVTSLILMVALSFLSSAFLNIPGLAGANTYADSISMTVSTDNLTINMAPMSSSGEFAKSANMNIAVSTTSSSGYNLSIASSTGNTNLTSGSNSITSINSAISESTFSSSSTYNNQWGYKPSNLYNSSTEQIITNTDFRPLPGTTGEIIAKTKCANGTSPCTNPVDNYTLSIGARTTNTTPKGDYVSDTFVITAVTNKSVVACDSSKLCVQYDGNGLSYPETSSQLPRTVNNVNYNSTTTSQAVTEYVHSENFVDDDDYPLDYYYAEETVTPVTISGASSLEEIDIEWGLDGADYLAIVEGSYTYDDIDMYMLVEIIYEYCPPNDLDCIEGYYNDYSGAELNFLGVYVANSYADIETPPTEPNFDSLFDIQTDSVSFIFYGHFPEETGGEAYGYYATIYGHGTAYDRSVSSGEYTTPTGTNAIFYGWSTIQTTAGGGLPSQVEYTNESDVLANLPGNEGETKTFYAVWLGRQAITFTMDSNISNIAVLDSSGTTVDTITNSGQSILLIQGDTYTIKPTYNSRYAPNIFAKASGAGTLTGSSGYSKSFQVGTGSATINITSQYVNTQIQNYSCSNLANVGSTQYVYDTRDDKVYLIGKLADNKCWMLDNLAIDLVNTSLDILKGNTNASDTTLEYLKGTRTGTTSDKYATAGVANWTSSYSNSAPLINATDKNNTTTSYGSGSGKIGVYYNYCAASAGSYCYGEGFSAGTSSGNATEDICPAGWRMPTGKTSGEYQALYTAYSSNVTNFRNALSTPLSGYFLNGSAKDQGSFGRFWSSTQLNDQYMYRLGVTSSNVYPAHTDGRGYGISVRCLLGS